VPLQQKETAGVQRRIFTDERSGGNEIISFLRPSANGRIASPFTGKRVQRPHLHDNKRACLHSNALTSVCNINTKGDHMDTPMQRYWKTNKSYMIVLLIVWAAVSYGCGIFFVEELNAIQLGGFPLGFWFAQQGSIFVFVLIILAYFLLMDRLDKKYDVHE
jgi:putative solute:sodium symporter small subunit